MGGNFAAASSFLQLSFIFFSIFSVAKHSSEDDNSENGWLNLFLLEEDGCWLGFEVNLRSSVLFTHAFMDICAPASHLRLKLLVIVL